MKGKSLLFGLISDRSVPMLHRGTLGTEHLGYKGCAPSMLQSYSATLELAA
jgi:hypothetical protein